jgi:hypothetical protein
MPADHPDTAAPAAGKRTRVRRAPRENPGYRDPRQIAHDPERTTGAAVAAGVSLGAWAARGQWADPSAAARAAAGETALTDLDNALAHLGAVRERLAFALLAQGVGDSTGAPPVLGVRELRPRPIRAAHRSRPGRPHPARRRSTPAPYSRYAGLTCTALSVLAHPDPGDPMPRTAAIDGESAAAGPFRADGLAQAILALHAVSGIGGHRLMITASAPALPRPGRHRLDSR